MIRNLVARFTLMALVAAACGPSSQPDTPASGDPAGALAEAKGRAQDLANSNQSYQPVRFVSDIEQVRPPRPTRTVKPDVVVRDGSEPVSAEPVPTPAIVAGDPVPSIQTDSTMDPVSTPRVPSIIPREAPLPAAVGGATGGSGEWRGNDPGPDMGTVIGVVLRGGRGDPGHCPRHPRPPSQIPNRIPR
jgi:hypothetical protein